MDNKQIRNVIIGLVVVVALAVVLRGRGASEEPAETTATPSVSVSVSATPVPKATTAGVPQPKTYGDAVEKYGNNRIQFDMYCQANPANNTYKNGTSIMLDNRSGDARIISVNWVQYALSGYGWKIIMLSSKVLPATWAVDCGSARNVSKILIQQ